MCEFLELLKYITSDLFIFVGCAVLLSIICLTIGLLVETIVVNVAKIFIDRKK